MAGELAGWLAGETFCLWGCYGDIVRSNAIRLRPELLGERERESWQPQQTGMSWQAGRSVGLGIN